MSIKGKIKDKKVLYLRMTLGSGTFTYPDGTKGKWCLTINVDSKLIFMEIEGKQKGTVEYSTQDMLIDSAKLLEEEAKRNAKTS